MRRIRHPRAREKPSYGRKREVYHAAYAFSEKKMNYYSIYYKDKSSEVLPTPEMMRRYPELLVKILEKMVL